MKAVLIFLLISIIVINSKKEWESKEAAEEDKEKEEKEKEEKEKEEKEKEEEKKLMSIEDFLDYLKSSGILSIMEQLIDEMGEQVAINFCEVFLEKPDPYCEKVVRIYLSHYFRTLSEIGEKLKEILFRDENLKILLNNGFDLETIERNILKMEKYLINEFNFK